MMHDFHNQAHQMLITMGIAQGNTGAMVAFTSICEREDKMILASIIDHTEFHGAPLHRLWKDVFSEDTEALAKALKGLSHNRLCEIKAMLESPELGIPQARIALGVDKL